MKVALITTDLGLTGVPRYLEILASALLKVSSLQVEVIALQPPLDRQKTLEEAGIPVQVLSPDGTQYPRREFSQRLKGLLEDMQPDLIHTNLWSRGLVTSWVAYRLGIPTVLTWHYWMRKGHFSINFNNTLKEIVVLHLQQLMGTHFIAVGDHIHRPGIMKHRIAKIFTGIPIEPEIDRKNQQPVIAIQAAQINPMKGQEDLLRSLALLPSPEVCEVWLAGEGPSRTKLEMMVKDLGLNNVRFMGWRHDVKDLMQRADLAVLPSYAEGMPLFVIESMMMGLPVVGYRIPALEVLVGDDCGILVKPGDLEALSAALAKLLQDTDLRRTMGAAAHRRAVTYFSDLTMGQKTLAVYERAWENA
jgi:glycosyltransferase involved in cell wall biosynthesis